MLDLYSYQTFVDGVTSEGSKSNDAYMRTIAILANKGMDVPRLSTASIGLSGEVGEFNDLIKKIFFQGKEYNEENKEKLESELGDIMWYWAQACMALHLDPYTVLKKNIKKLESIYPGGKFSVEKSEKR